MAAKVVKYESSPWFNVEIPPTDLETWKKADRLFVNLENVVATETPQNPYGTTVITRSSGTIRNIVLSGTRLGRSQADQIAAALTFTR